MSLIEALEKIKSEKLVSFHMPGHKNGRLVPKEFMEILKYDITEIPGADHLHDANNCILETEQKISNLYNSEISKLLINGSTVGILSMIMGLTKKGDKVLVNRNAHKSIYNAIEMNELEPIYIYPEVDDFLGIPIDLKLHAIEDVKICILTYPTYEGLCYSIEEIIEMCHSRGIPVVVDEAHGAHLFLHKEGPKSALELGADLVVQSFHKTLPTMTQTGCIHISKRNILTGFQLDRLNWYLKSLQSSSPSYVLMASIDAMITLIKSDGTQLSECLEVNISSFYKRASLLKHLRFIRLSNGDVTKLLLSIPCDDYVPEVWDGNIISKMLRENYGIQSEYDTSTLVLFMTSISNSKEDFEALNLALELLDQWFEINLANMSVYKDRQKSQIDLIDMSDKYNRVYHSISTESSFVYKASDAVLLKYKLCSLEEAIGEVSAEYITPYPPGIPILVPGERISKSIIEMIPKDVCNVKIIEETINEKIEVYNE